MSNSTSTVTTGDRSGITVQVYVAFLEVGL